MGERGVLKLDLDASRAMAMLAPSAAERTHVATRAVEWLLRQDEAVRITVLGLVSPQAAGLLCARALDRLGRSAGEARPGRAAMRGAGLIAPAASTTRRRTLTLPSRVHRLLVAHCDAHALDPARVVSRLLVWLIGQSLLVRTVVLGRSADNLDAAAATVILRRALHQSLKRPR